VNGGKDRQLSRLGHLVTTAALVQQIQGFGQDVGCLRRAAALLDVRQM
jgi:hypothetical protein